MNRPTCAILLEDQHARPLRIIRIILDHDRRVESTDNLTHLDTVRREFIVPVSGYSYIAACHEHAHRVEGLTQCLRAFVVANLPVDLVHVSTHVPPGAGKVLRVQLWIEPQQVSIRRSKLPRLFQDPDVNASTGDERLTAAHAVDRVDARVAFRGHAQKF